MEALLIISKNLPPAPVGLAYSEQLQGIGGTPPYTWSLVSGSLPSGMALSTSGLLTAGAGAIPASATGMHTFRLKLRDFVGTEVFYDYTLEVAPAAYGRVPEFLLDARFRELVGKYLLADSNRQKNERHFFRDLIGALGDTYAHLDRDIQAPDWKTPGNDVSVRTALDEIYALTLLAIKTINGINPDGSGEFGITSGSSLTITPQPNGLRLDVDFPALDHLDEYSVEADVAPWSNQTLLVPSLPDVAETWIRNNLVTEWDRVSEGSDKIVKYVTAPAFPFPDAKIWSCALGSDTAGTSSYFFKVTTDVALGSYVVEKYDATTLTLLASLSLGLGGLTPYGEPLIMQCPASPRTLIVCGVVLAGGPPPAAGASLLYHEIDPDGSMLAINVGVFPAANFDPAAIGVHPNYDEAYDSGHWRLYGTFINDPMSFTGASAVIALKLQYGLAINQSEPTLVTFPVLGAPGPLGPVAAVRLGQTDADTLDVSYDPGSVPNPVLWVVANFRWTNGAAATLDLYKLSPPVAGITWTSPLPAAIAPPVPFFALSIDSSATDGMEFAKAKMAIDAATRDSLAVVYVKDVFLDPIPFPVMSGPPRHQPRLQCVVVKDISLAGASVVPGGISSEDMVTLQSAAEGEFGRWWYSGGASLVYYLDPKQSADRVYIRRHLFDTAGPIGAVEDILNHPLRNASPARAIIRTAIGEEGFLDVNPRSCIYLSSIASPEAHAIVQAIDSPVRPSAFRTYYDGTNLVFENNTPFAWHVKMEALAVAPLVPKPDNMMVACWYLAQGLQNYWNANNYYPSASCNPPGPGGVQGTVWNEIELGVTATGGKVFYPTYYSVLPGTWDLQSGVLAQAKYYSVGGATTSTDQWLVFRYTTMPAVITAAEAGMAAVIGAAIPAPGVYNLAQIDAAMGMGGAWVTAYSGSPYNDYQYFCFVNANSTGFYHGWFSQNYIHNAQVYGPAPAGGVSSVPFIEQFTVAADATPGVPTEFIISRFCRFAEVAVNGIAYYQGPDWAYGITMNRIRYLNNPPPSGYSLHAGDVVSIKYLV